MLWVFFFFCSSIRTFAQPKADFTVNATHGCGSLVTFFSDKSSGNPTTWFWDFGNGQTSIIQNPSIVYSAPGSYTVTLTVTNNAGNDNNTKTNYIVVDAKPIAQFDLSAGKGCLPFPLSFTDYSNPVSGTITNWWWDFGDSSVSNLQNPTYTYNKDGIFSVKLTVQNSKGCIDSLVLVDTVSVGAKPTPDFVANLFNVCASVPINFNNKTKGSYTSFYWEFGDGDTSTKTGPLHYFDDTGFMNVKLKAYNNGCVDSIEKKKYVFIKPPIVRIRYTFNCDSPYTRNFQARFLGAKSYVWDFGDGTTSSTSKQPSHTYQNPGTYIVSLYAIADTCDYTDTAMVSVVDEHPTYSFISKPNACKYDTIRFKADNYNPAFVDGFAWDYGDGTIASFSKLPVSNYAYKRSGIFYPSLIVRNILGCFDTIKNNTGIQVYGPLASFAVDTFVCTNFNVDFRDLSTNDGYNPITTWIWQYGDGKFDSLQSAPFKHNYAVTGIYTIKLKVKDAIGCSDTLVKLNGLTAIPKPVAAINIIDTVSCFLSSVSFFDQSQGQQLGRHWFFGDGDTSSQSYEQHIYSQPGLYNAMLIVGSQQGCSDTARGIVRIVALPTVDAGVDTFLCYGKGLSLKPTGADSYNWYADPSLSCTACTNPFVQPFSSTHYFVTGTNKEGCTALDSVIVEVKPMINLSFQKTLDSICYGQFTQLIATGSELYNWFPASGLSSANIPNPIASPSLTTSYTIIGTDSKNCFRDTGYVTVVVIPNPQFNIIDTNIVIAAGSFYTIKTTNSPDVVKWQWAPPTDLTCTNCPQPQAKGNRIVEYTGTAYNAFGCAVTDKIKVTGLCNNQVIFVPNTFSPNGDGVNDHFYLRGKGLYIVKSMRIFSRWGQAVFQKLNFAADVESEGWDGTNYGKKLPSDVYIYYIEVMCNNGATITLRGDITLLL
ncbi:PKD domain-containing protein [Panacibacter ginsenosidivorans]|uniref:PKD domain-containing protein n=1 Tax=Panacibacter ginsenosidivorans TaxID=1813871 RepID=A0A5B8V9Z5_9BACT|nr:PKD domain-containing protein [Panacibacter ginsenosidivorans]